MLRLSTKKKLRLARLLYSAISVPRAISGLQDRVAISRNGIHYALDLAEGIDLAFYLGIYERRTLQRVVDLLAPGDIAFDIGANVGLFALQMAKQVGQGGKVYAFEPTSYAMDRARSSIELNPAFGQIITLVQAYMNADGRVLSQTGFHASWDLKRTPCSTHPDHGGRLKRADGAAADTVDGFIKRNTIGRVDLIKIDVDGFELEVLQGAAESVRRFRPAIICEICPRSFREYGYGLAEFISAIRFIGYRLVDERNMANIELTEGFISAHIPKNGSINGILLPR